MHSNFKCTYDVPIHFTPVYHNAMQSYISKGEEEARKPLGFAYVS